MEIVGVRRIEYVSKKTGNPVKGYEIHTEEQRKDVTGVATEKIFVGEEKAKNCGFMPEVGQEIEVAYNRFGSVQAVEVFKN